MSNETLAAQKEIARLCQECDEAKNEIAQLKAQLQAAQDIIGRWERNTPKQLNTAYRAGMEKVADSAAKYDLFEFSVYWRNEAKTAEYPAKPLPEI